MPAPHTGPQFVRHNGYAGCDHEWALSVIGAPCGCSIDECVKDDCPAKRHRPLIARAS